MMDSLSMPDEKNNSLNVVLHSINYDFEGAKIRIMGTPEAPWFCGKDVAQILEYKDTDKALRNHVRDRNKKKLHELLKIYRPADLAGLENFTNNELEMIYINEAGMYSLILRSKMKKAEHFQDWLCDDVLPSIRKVGQQQYLEQLQMQQLQIKEYEEKIQEKDEIINKKTQDGFYHNIISKNCLTLKKFIIKDLLLYYGSFTSKAEEDYYNEKIGSGKDRDVEFSTASSVNNPFDIKEFEIYNSLEYTSEKLLHSLLAPFHIKTNSIQRKNRKGSHEHYQIFDKWLNIFIKKFLFFQEFLVKDVNDLIDLLDSQNRNYNKVENILDNILNHEQDLRDEIINKVKLDTFKQNNEIRNNYYEYSDIKHESQNTELKEENKESEDNKEPQIAVKSKDYYNRIFNVIKDYDNTKILTKDKYLDTLYSTITIECPHQTKTVQCKTLLKNGIGCYHCKKEKLLKEQINTLMPKPLENFDDYKIVENIKIESKTYLDAGKLEKKRIIIQNEIIDKLNKDQMYLLSLYTNSVSYLNCLCRYGHTYSITWNNLKTQSSDYCKSCRELKRKINCEAKPKRSKFEDELRQRAQEVGWSYVGYTEKKSVYEFLCKNGHSNHKEKRQLVAAFCNECNKIKI